MLYDYIITLRKQSSKTVDVVSQILYVIAVITFVYFSLASRPLLNTYLIAAVAIAGCWVFLSFRKKKAGTVYYTPGLAIAALAWFTGPFANIWLGLLYIAAALVEREFKFPK